MVIFTTKENFNEYSTVNLQFVHKEHTVALLMLNHYNEKNYPSFNEILIFKHKITEHSAYLLKETQVFLRTRIPQRTIDTMELVAPTLVTEVGQWEISNSC